MLGMMTLVALSHHLGLMWVAMEATTLVTAPLIYFNHNARSLEATWKYLLIGSVGIALALLGSFFLAYCVAQGRAGIDVALRPAGQATPRTCRRPGSTRRSCCSSSATAPRWAWPPCTPGSRTPTAKRRGWSARCWRAASRAVPSWRSCGSIRSAAPGPTPSSPGEIMVFMGLLSMAVAAVFMVRQRDFKRMLAYSSVEHMGILVLGVGIGGLAVYGALLHMINNGLTKGVLFLSAGNIHRAYGSKLTDDVQGAIQRVPLSGGLFLAGFPGHHRLAAVWPVRERIHHRERRGRQRTVHRHAACSCSCSASCSSAWGPPSWPWSRGSPGTGKQPTGFTTASSTERPDPRVHGARAASGVYIPPPLESLLREAAASLEVKR